MDAFRQACKVENEAMLDLLPFIQQQAFEGRFVITDKGNLSEFLQKTVGDILLTCTDRKLWSVEIKSEASNRWGNFFLETWSNRSRHKRGWMDHLDADILMYYFVEEKDLYTIDFRALKRWAFDRVNSKGGMGRIHDYPEKRQNKYDQLNDTWGVCVPIQVVRAEVGLTHYNLLDKEVKAVRTVEVQGQLWAEF